MRTWSVMCDVVWLIEGVAGRVRVDQTQECPTGLSSRASGGLLGCLVLGGNVVAGRSVNRWCDGREFDGR